MRVSNGRVVFIVICVCFQLVTSFHFGIFSSRTYHARKSGQGGTSPEFALTTCIQLVKTGCKRLLTKTRFQLRSSPCFDIKEPKVSDKLRIIISGAPASGKGTQCELLKSKFGVVHISTGELLRSAMRDNSDLGNKVRTYMDACKLVPDDIIINVVCERLNQPDCQQCGWLLDGFPRTEAQAEALYAVGHIADCFIHLDVDQNVLLDRVTGRRTDPITGKVYHTIHNPAVDPDVIKRLVQRSDDTADKIVTRLADYLKHTEAVRSHFEDRIVVVDGSAHKDKIADQISEVLTDIKNRKIGGKVTENI